MSLIIIFLIALSLSMDAFSLALTIGTQSIQKKEKYIISSIVGIFHFVMPILGTYLGTKFINYFKIDINFITGIIFLYISVQMFKEMRSDDDINFTFGIINSLIFAFGVSLDSFGIGFTFKLNNPNNLIYFFIFLIFSFTFTYLGLNLGNKLQKKYGDLASLFGMFILLMLAIFNLIKFCVCN